MEATGHALGSHDQRSTRQRMKLKDCGVRGNKILFVRQQDLAKYDDQLIALDVLLNGTITVVPNTQRVNTKLCGQVTDPCLFCLTLNTFVPSLIRATKKL